MQDGVTTSPLISDTSMRAAALPISERGVRMVVSGGSIWSLPAFLCATAIDIMALVELIKRTPLHLGFGAQPE